ncbi:MAG TPA: GspH/FimT family pseudopilin [Gemmatimonadaceae bacterium]|nr:GspH/FimT family pseudopilin [Gemmatimonadaceae bacterium]
MKQIGPHDAKPMSRGARGFTFIELLAVLAIVAIVALFAFPRVNFTQFQVDAAARGVRMTLQNAQRLAVTRQFNVVVSFDQANGRVRVFEDNNNNSTIDAGERVTYFVLEDGAQFVMPPTGVNGPVGGAINGAALTTINSLPSIVFRRDGAGSSDLEVYLTSKRAQPNDWRGITVVQSTGRTDWYKYIGATWKAGNL